MKKSKLFSVMCSSVLAAAIVTDCIVPLNDRSSVRAEETSSATIAYEDDYCSGDINSDGVINIFDFSRLNRYLEGNLEFDADQLKAADFNYDRSVDEGDLAEMSGFITMYSEMPVNYHRRRLILNAKNFFLKYGETTDIELSIKIPDDWEKNDITVTGDGEKIAVIPFSSLTEGEKIERDGYNYTEYTVSVPVPDQGDNDTRGFSVDLTVQMNGQESYPVMLNRAVKDAKERIDKSGELIGNVSEYADSLPEGSSKEEVLSEMKKWIEANPDLEITSTSSDTIHFKTSYGINSYFEIDEELVYEQTDSEETENIDIAEILQVTENNRSTDTLNYSAFNSGFLHATTNKDELFKIFLNTSPQNNSSSDRLTTTDPDVLLYIPCDKDSVISKSIDKLRNIGSDLADNIDKYGPVLSNTDKGKFDEFIGSAFCDWSTYSKWTQYGTVIWHTHSGRKDYGNNNIRTYYCAYNAETTEELIAKVYELHDSVNNISDFITNNNNPDEEISYLIDDWSLGIIYRSNLTIGIGSGTLMQLFSDSTFPNTVFYFHGCRGLCDETFNQFLIDHGAAGLIGFNEKNVAEIGNAIADYLFDIAFKESLTENHQSFSLKSAVDTANYVYHSIPNPEFISLNGAATLYNTVFPQEKRSLTASIYYQKDFYYWGLGVLKGSVQGVPYAKVNIYRYYNEKLAPIYGDFTADANGNFSISNLSWGSYLIQVIDENENTEAFIRTDFTEPELDLGEIVFQKQTEENEPETVQDELYWYVYKYYLLLEGKVPSDVDVYNYRSSLKQQSITVSTMAYFFYLCNDDSINKMDNRSWALIAYNVFVGKTPDDAKRKELDMIASSGQSHENIAKYIVESNDFKNRCAELNILPGEW